MSTETQWAYLDETAVARMLREITLAPGVLRCTNLNEGQALGDVTFESRGWSLVFFFRDTDYVKYLQSVDHVMGFKGHYDDWETNPLDLLEKWEKFVLTGYLIRAAEAFVVEIFNG